MGNLTYTKEDNAVRFNNPAKTAIRSLKTYFSPIQTGSGDPTTENVRPIVTREQIKTIICGSNLYDKDTIGYTQSRYIDWQTGNAITWGSGWWVTDFIPIAEKIPYTLWTNANGATFDGYAFYNENKVYISGAMTNGSLSGTIYHFTSPANAKFFRCSYVNGIYPILEVGTLNQVSNSSYNGNTITTSLNSFDDLYGGYVDLISGEVYCNYKKTYLKDIIWNRFGSNNYGYGYITSRPLKGLFFCDELIPSNNGNGNLTEGKIGYNALNSNNYINCVFLRWDQGAITDDTKLAQFREWVTETYPNAYIIYEIKAASLYTTLTPQQLETFNGINTIYSDVGKVSIEYDLKETKEMADRKHFIMLNNPHLKTTSGLISSFKTDLAAPIKNCKVHFSPIQEGSGDPSPTNVRPIGGWTGLDVTKCGKNLYDTTNIGYINSRYVEWETGNLVFWGSFWNATNYIPIIGNLDYTIFGICNSKDEAGCAFYDDNQTYISGIQMMNSQINRFYIHSPNNAKYLRFSFISDSNQTILPMLQYGTISESTFQSYSGTTLSVDWTSNGEIYGGYIDLITGELYQEWKRSKIADLSWNNYSAKIYYYTWMPARESNSIIYSDTLTPKGNDDFLKNGVGDLSYYVNRYLNYVWTKLPSAMEYNEANAWIDENYPNAYIVTKLATPTLIGTINPNQLNTFIDINNIYSTANANVDTTYWTH